MSILWLLLSMHTFSGSIGGEPGACKLFFKGSFAMSERPLIVDWKGLKKLGWCYSRAHTWRLMFDPEYGDRRFPACRKLGKHPNAHPVWRMSEILAYFESHGLKVTEDWNAS